MTARGLAKGDQTSVQRPAHVDDFWAALARLMGTGDAAGVLRLAGALAVFWHHQGYLDEGRRWLEWALVHAVETPTARARPRPGRAEFEGVETAPRRSPSHG